MGYLGLRTTRPASQLWIRCKNCFAIWRNERDRERHVNYYINGFSERNLIQGNLIILAQKWYFVLITLVLHSGFVINFAK